MAPGLGLEPRYTASKAVVLPLDDPGRALILGHTCLAIFARFAPRNPHRTVSVRLRLRVPPASRISSKHVLPRLVQSMGGIYTHGVASVNAIHLNRLFMDPRPPVFSEERSVFQARACVRRFFEEIVCEGGEFLCQGLPEELIRALADFSQEKSKVKDHALVVAEISEQIDQLTRLLHARMDRDGWSSSKKLLALDAVVQLRDIVSDPWYAVSLVRMIDHEQGIACKETVPETNGRSFLEPRPYEKTVRMPPTARLPFDREKLLSAVRYEETEGLRRALPHATTVRPPVAHVPMWKPQQSLIQRDATSQSVSPLEDVLFV